MYEIRSPLLRSVSNLWVFLFAFGLVCTWLVTYTHTPHTQTICLIDGKLGGRPFKTGFTDKMLQIIRNMYWMYYFSFIWSSISIDRTSAWGAFPFRYANGSINLELNFKQAIWKWFVVLQTMTIFRWVIQKSQVSFVTTAFFFYFVVIPKFHSSFNQYMCFYYVQNIVSMWSQMWCGYLNWIIIFRWS